MTGYFALAREARRLRQGLPVQGSEAERLVNRLLNRLRDPTLILPAFLCGFAVGQISPAFARIAAPMAVAGRHSRALVKLALALRR